ncbi:MAG: hypothetical protein J6J60_08105 [Clostridia bacterium]|nr:hypothetical protein [Clostridia bacterium]
MNNYLAPLLLSIFFLIFMLLYINKKKNNQLVKAFSISIILMLFWCTSLILQITLSSTLNIDPIYFEYLVYTAAVFLPIAVYFIGLIYTNTRIKLKRKHFLLFIIPIFSLLAVWTNNIHHLFFKDYSIYMSEGTSGPIMVLYSVYSYVLLGIGIFKLLNFNIKNSGFFSKQSLLIILGIAIPVVANILGTLKIIPMTVYVTPICFTFTLFFLTIAMFKFNFLEAAPIALQKIVDRISDSYIVLNDSNIVIDFNLTFLHTFQVRDFDIRNKDIGVFIKNSEYQINTKKFANALKKARTTAKTQRITETFATIERTFTIEISDLVSQGKFLGIVILFKDITQHIQDMETIKNNQEMLIERERLASLGQMIGGIAHNLKTPIFSIAGGLEGINELVNEYQASIDSPQVTSEDMHAIGEDIREWLEKMRKHLEYMSDIITAVKGQAVTFSEDTNVAFPISEAFKHVEILMKHDLKHSLTNLYIDNKVPDNIILQGNMNGLIQVIDNLIANAIYVYKSEGKTDQVIDLSANYLHSINSIEIRVKDYGPGLPQGVQDKLFKEMVTTKGKEGTGLGLFMSASNIKAQFSGRMDYETKAGKGTTFIITLPVPTAVNA